MEHAVSQLMTALSRARRARRGGERKQREKAAFASLPVFIDVMWGWGRKQPAVPKQRSGRNDDEEEYSEEEGEEEEESEEEGEEEEGEEEDYEEGAEEGALGALEQIRRAGDVAASATEGAIAQTRSLERHNQAASAQRAQIRAAREQRACERASSKRGAGTASAPLNDDASDIASEFHVDLSPLAPFVPKPAACDSACDDGAHYGAHGHVAVYDMGRPAADDASEIHVPLARPARDRFPDFHFDLRPPGAPAHGLSAAEIIEMSLSHASGAARAQVEPVPAGHGSAYCLAHAMPTATSGGGS